MGKVCSDCVVVVQDLHLAKRFYDQAIVNSRHTTVPVHAALWGLWFHSLLLVCVACPQREALSTLCFHVMVTCGVILCSPFFTH